MGEDRIKDVEIKTECFVQQDAVQHQMKHRHCSICFLFSKAVISRKDSLFNLGKQFTILPLLTSQQYLKQSLFYRDLFSMLVQGKQGRGCILREDFQAARLSGVL